MYQGMSVAALKPEPRCRPARCLVQAYASNRSKAWQKQGRPSRATPTATFSILESVHNHWDESITPFQPKTWSFPQISQSLTCISCNSPYLITPLWLRKTETHGTFGEKGTMWGGCFLTKATRSRICTEKKIGVSDSTHISALMNIKS